MQLRKYAAVLTLGLVFGNVGCAEKNTPPPGPSQEMTSAQERIRELERELNEASAGGARDKEQIRALENELARLRQQLAERPATVAPAPGWSSVPGGAMTSIEGTILFDSGKVVLKTSARQTLEAVVAVITRKYPEYDVYVFGHTDDEPIRKSGWKDNYELSAQRALSVVRMLRSQGVENKMAAAGWGEQLPLEEGSTAAARQRNRRVEIYAMAPEHSRGGHSEAAPPSGAGRGGEEPAIEAPAPRRQPARRSGGSAAPAKPGQVP